jgi:hypothetical protein
MGNTSSTWDVGDAVLASSSGRSPVVILPMSWVSTSTSHAGILCAIRSVDELIHGDAATPASDRSTLSRSTKSWHIKAEKSAALLDQLEQIAKERIIVSTPNGDNRRGPVGGVQSEAHISTWTAF